MKEIDVARRVNHILQGCGYNTDTNRDAVVCPKCHTKIIPTSGKPDVTIPLMYIEYKVLRIPGETSFSFASITPEQREWLTGWMERGNRGYLGLGIIDTAGSRDKLVSLYLVDWGDWLEVEAVISPVQASIPYQVGRHTRKALRPDKDIVNLLARFELVKNGREWRLPMGHTAIPR